MIRALFVRERERLISFTLKGHAGYAAEGSDIVCAAASGLAQSVIGTLDELKIPFEYSIRDGEISCQVFYDRMEEIDSIRAEALMDCVCIGMMQMAGVYSEYIETAIQEANDD